MSRTALKYFKLCVALLLIAKGFLHFTSHQPYEFLFESNIWLEYSIGLVLIFFGVMALQSNQLLTKGRWIYTFCIPGIILIVQSAAGYAKAGFVPEQFVEHSLQMSLPFLLIYLVKSKRLNWTKFYYHIAILVGLTFVGHAIFALGIHFVPDNFIEMTSRSLLISEAASVDFLFVMGLLDIFFAVLCFFPVVRKYAIWYMVFWGFLTAFARVYYVLGDGPTIELFTVNFPNMLYRLPHALIPALMLLILPKLNVGINKRKLLFQQ